jgi:hypothetical protein
MLLVLKAMCHPAWVVYPHLLELYSHTLSPAFLTWTGHGKQTHCWFIVAAKYLSCQ